MKPEDLKRFSKVSDHTLSGDGTFVVLALTRVVANRVDSELWSVETSGNSSPRRLTHGFRDLGPSISPDGARVAFIRTVGATCCLCIYDIERDSIEVVAESGSGMGTSASVRHIRAVAAPQWAPDAKRIAYVASCSEGRQFPESEVAIIRQLPFQFDGRGYIHEKFLQIHLADATGRSPSRPFTTAQADHWDVCWRPDGRALCFASNRPVGNGLPAQALYTAAVDSSSAEERDCRRLTDGGCTVNLPTYSFDGRSIYFIGIGPYAPESPDIRARNVSLWLVDAEVGTCTRLSDPQTVDVDESRVRPLAMGANGNPLLTTLHRGCIELGEWADGRLVPVVRGKQQVSSYAHANGVTTAVIADTASAGDLFAIRDGASMPLTRWCGEYDDVHMREFIEIEGASVDGYPLHGWLLLPPGRGPHPLLLLIHGGPDTQWGYFLNEEAQVFASAGFAVLLPNPRGSAGYGESHARALNGRLGEVDVDDVLGLLDRVVTRDDVDSDRVGVLGRSYGGFLTAWLASHHGERFRAAVGECGIYDWRSALATSDIGWQLSVMVGEDPRDWDERSPLLHADRIKMPFLVMQYLSDLRIPMEQGHKMFSALFRAGNPTELVQFNGGPHTFAETGPPNDRVARLNIIIDWFKRWLVDSAPNAVRCDRTPAS